MCRKTEVALRRPLWTRTKSPKLAAVVAMLQDVRVPQDHRLGVPPTVTVADTRGGERSNAAPASCYHSE